MRERWGCLGVAAGGILDVYSPVELIIGIATTFEPRSKNRVQEGSRCIKSSVIPRAFSGFVGSFEAQFSDSPGFSGKIPSY